MLDREVLIRDWLHNGYSMEEFLALEQDGYSLSYILDVLIGRNLHTIITKRDISKKEERARELERKLKNITSRTVPLDCRGK